MGFAKARFVALALLLLQGCVSEPIRSTSDRIETRTHEAVLSYSFSGCSSSLSKAEQHRITGFLNAMKPERKDAIVVSVPKACTANGDAARRKAITGLMAQFPAQVRIVQDTDFRQMKQAEARGIVRLVRAVGFRVQCGNGAPANGCSNARNLARMIGNPIDMMFPTGGSRYHSPSTRQTAGQNQ